MNAEDMLFWLVERAAHELALFAAVAFLIGGIDDLAVDFIWLVRSAWRKFAALCRKRTNSSIPKERVFR